MIRVLAASGVVAAVGWMLVLGEVRWFRRRTLVARVGPYLPGVGSGRSAAARIGTAASLSELVEPLAQAIGGRVARLFGVDEALAVRLERVHSAASVSDFRIRQLGWALVACLGGAVVSAALHLPGAVALGFLLGSPLLALLVVEQQLAARSDRHKRRVFVELPVVAEQLAMLVGAGYSLGGALRRLGERSRGACGADIRRVCERIQLGLGEAAALKEWADVVDVPAVRRFVGVLALNRQAGDLDRLISEEARAIRRDVHRDLVVAIERRAQQVWVPVTVATLVPGTIFLAVPFVEALRLFSQAS